MLLNENRGSFGMFSRAGRNAAEKFHILVKKDEILSGNPKRIHLKDFFAPDDEKKNVDYDDKLDIFKSDMDDKDREISRTNSKTKNKYKKISHEKNQMKKLLQSKKNKKNKLPDPTCTKYNPKNEYIWKRTKTGPCWDQSIKKNFSIKPNVEVDPKFYLSHSDFKIDGRNFIDLSRQTNRRYITGEVMRNAKSVNIAKRKNITTSANNPPTSENNFNEENARYTGIINITDSSREKSINTNRKVKTTKSLNKTYRQVSPKSRAKIHAPDFKKIISREYIEKAHGNKKTIIPFSFPNFKWTTSSKIFLLIIQLGPIMMVKYNRKEHKVRKEKHFQGPLSTEINFDPDKILDKVNNHKTVKTPNFDLMLTRPKDDGPLPSFMKVKI